MPCSLYKALINSNNNYNHNNYNYNNNIFYSTFFQWFYDGAL